MQTGDVLENRFELKRVLGEGGMGQVWQAWDRELERAIAIKVLLPQLSSDPMSMREMKREVKLSQKLSHPNIVSVYDYRVHERTPYIVMEFVEGEPLHHFLFRQPGECLDEVQFRRLAFQILDAVGYAHQSGVVHRDLKPANIMMLPDGSVKLMDFGIAAAMKATYTRLSTLTSALTVQYSSPEQIGGESPAPSMDIYSLGCVFYEILAGHPPFYQGDVIYQQINREPQPVAGVSDLVNRAILSCLVKNPEERLQSVEEIRAALTGDKTVKLATIAKPLPVTPKRALPLARIGMVAAGSLLVLAGVLRWKQDQSATGHPAPASPPALSSRIDRAPAERLAAPELPVPESRAKATAGVLIQPKPKPLTSTSEDPKSAKPAPSAAEVRANELRVWIPRSIGEGRLGDADAGIEELLGLVPRDEQIVAWRQQVARKREEQQARAAIDNKVAALRLAIQQAIADRKWDLAERSLSDLSPLVPQDERVTEWMRQVRDGRSAEERTAALKAADAERQARERLEANKALAVIEFVKIAPGEYRHIEDKRSVRVVVSRPFEMARYEVTQAQWQAVMSGNPSHFRSPTRPVENVSWQDAQSFLAKLNAKADGFRYDLPTEAQWEYAARAGRQGEITILKETDAWYADNSSAASHPVGQKQPNPWGLYDMLGNVEEWCKDPYSSVFSANDQRTEQAAPPTGFYVLRGGSWGDYPQALRYGRRDGRTPSDRASFIGFRCIREKTR